MKLLLLAALLASVACASTRLRVVHAVPGASNVDFQVNGAVTGVRNLAYTQASEYIDIRPGILTLAVATREEVDNVKAQGDFEIVSNVDYTLLYLRSATDGPATLQLKIDDNTQPREKFSHIRFIHAAPVSPPVPIVVEANGMPIFSGFEYGQASVYQALPAGFYNITFSTTTFPDGALSPEKSVLTTVPDVRYESRTVYTLFALGLNEVIAALSVDSAATAVDPCAQCPCPGDMDFGFTTNTEVNFVFEDMVPPQTACCKKGF